MDPEATTRALVGTGGRILEVGGTEVVSPATFAATLTAVAELGGEIELQVAREGAERSRMVLEQRPSLVDPTLLTAARASLPESTAGERVPPLASPGVDPAAATTESYTVSAAALRVLTDEPAEAAKLVRIVPDRDGRGFKLYGIRGTRTAGGLSLSELGFRNGDIVRSINGVPISDMEAVLDLYTKVRTTDRWSIEIERRGAPVTLVIERGA